MTVPTPVDFSVVPNGGVFQLSDQSFWIKVDAGGAVNLASGHYNATLSGSVLYFADAHLAV